MKMCLLYQVGIYTCGLERKPLNPGLGLGGGQEIKEKKKRNGGFLLPWFNKASKEICKALAGLHGF